MSRTLMGLTPTRLLNGPITTLVPGVRDNAKNVVIAGNGSHLVSVLLLPSRVSLFY